MSKGDYSKVHMRNPPTELLVCLDTKRPCFVGLPETAYFVRKRCLVQHGMQLATRRQHECSCKEKQSGSHCEEEKNEQKGKQEEKKGCACDGEKKDKEALQYFIARNNSLYPR